jgi:Histidine phosphatase superfamily (branch 2)
LTSFPLTIPQLDGMQELFELASAFENSVVPQEYGTDRDDKRRIGSKMCKALLEKIKYDLTITMVSEE